jgi:transposase, IS30 family
MKPYTHLTQDERDKISVQRNRGKTWRQIARMLKRSHTALSREFRRNGRGVVYYPHRAQEKAVKRRQNHKRMRLKTRLLRSQIERMIMDGWSPEIIAGRLKDDHHGRPVISHEAVYQWIYSEAPHLIGYLVRSHPSRKPRRSRRAVRSRIPDRTPLAERPSAANSRQEIGHLEADLVVGPGRSALQVIVDRKTRFVRLEKVPNKSAAACRLALSRRLKPLPAPLRRSLTYDNGLENAEHTLLNQDIGTRSFFCATYHSWEKPSVENTNGLLRRFWPKRTNFDTIHEQDIQRVEDWLNRRPRKCLLFKTSAEVQASSLGALQG